MPYGNSAFALMPSFVPGFAPPQQQQPKAFDFTQYDALEEQLRQEAAMQPDDELDAELMADQPVFRPRPRQQQPGAAFDFSQYDALEKQLEQETQQQPYLKPGQPASYEQFADDNSDLVEKYQQADREMKAESPGSDWIKYFAKRSIPGFSTGYQIADLESARRAADKLETEPLSNEDAYALAKLLNEMEDDQKRTGLKQAGNVLAELPAFAGELLATAGTGAIARQAVTKALTKLVARRLAKKSVGRFAARQAIGATAKTAQVAAQTALQPLQMMKNTLNRNVRQTLAGERESLGVSALHGVGQTALETATEMLVGKAIQGLVGKGKGFIAKQLAEKTPKLDKLRQRLVENWVANKSGRTLAEGWKKVADQAGWNGMLGEMGEERVNEIALGLAGELGATGSEYEFGATGKLASGKFGEAYADLWPEMLAFAIPGSTMAAAGGVANYYGLGKSKQQKIDDYMERPDSERLYRQAVQAGMPAMPAPLSPNRENRINHAKAMQQAAVDAAQLAAEPPQIQEGGDPNALREEEGQGGLREVAAPPDISDEENLRMLLEDANQGMTPPDAVDSATASPTLPQESPNEPREELQKVAMQQIAISDAATQQGNAADVASLQQIAIPLQPASASLPPQEAASQQPEPTSPAFGSDAGSAAAQASEKPLSPQERVAAIVQQAMAENLSSGVVAELARAANVSPQAVKFAIVKAKRKAEANPPPPSVAATPSPAVEQSASGVPGATAQDYSVDSLKAAFNLTDEQAVATDALVQSIGLETSKIKVAKGGTSGEGALFQDGKQVEFKDNILESLKSWQNRGTPQQLQAHIAKTKGAKEYAEWIGLDEFLNGKPSVTKSDVEAFVKANQVKVQEVTLGTKPTHDQLVELAYNDMREVLGSRRGGISETTDSALDTWLASNGKNDWAESIINEAFEEAGETFDVQDMLAQAGKHWGSASGTRTKFENYTTPGGENYREVLLTLPNNSEARELHERIINSTDLAEGDRLADEFAARFGNVQQALHGNEFRSSHFDEPNIVAHVRVNDRTSADGKKTLFIEEIQSDWHQEGRRKGYGDEAQNARDKLAAKINDILRETNQIDDRFTDDLDAVDAQVRNGDFTSDTESWQQRNLLSQMFALNREIQTGQYAMPTLAKQSQQMQEKYGATMKRRDELHGQYVTLRNEMEAFPQGKGVPDAPFKQTWPMLAFKRIVQYASENGYDQIAWTTGEQQAERYDLSKQVRSVSWIPDSPALHGDRIHKKGRLQVVGNQGESVYNEAIDASKLEDIVGKEVAKKMLDSPLTRLPNGLQGVELRDSGLKVGGEGMKGFYDKILPSEVNRYVKQWGGRVGTTQIEVEENLSASNNRERELSEFWHGMRSGQLAPTTIEEYEIVDGDLSQNDFIARHKKEQGVETGKVHSLTITPAMRAAVTGQGQMLFQGEKGSAEFTANGDAILRGLANPDISTAIHEVAHVARRTLLNRDVSAENRAGITDADIKIAETWSGAPNGKWSVRAEEKFARGLERHLRDNTSVTGPMGKVFEKIAAWLKGIYQTIKDSPLDIKISKAMREVFDKVITRTSRLQAGAIPSDASAGVPASPPASATSKGKPDVRPKAEAPSNQQTTATGDQPVRDSGEVVRKREKRAAKLKPDEQALAGAVNETIKRAERVAEQHAGSPHGDELKAVVESEKRNRDAAVIGTETTIKAPGMEDIPARFGLLDIGNVIASHDFTNGAANSSSNVASGRYPADLQPRSYDAGSDNYEKVVTNARQFDERELLADSAYATVGPPVVTPNGIVLNGNGRTMTLQVARHIGKGDRYQQALRERLALYGLTEADAAGMEFPVLVRIVDLEPSSPQAKQFAEVGNISATQAQSPAETARKLSSLLPDNIVATLRLEGEETFAEAINGKRFLDALRQAWPPTERATYFESDGTLTAAGKDIVRNTLLQRIAPLKTLEKLTDAQSNMVASAIPQILTLQQQHPDLNVAPQLIEAMTFRNTHDVQSMAHVELALREQDLFSKSRPTLSDGAKTLMPWLLENQNKPTALREANKRLLAKVVVEKGPRLFDAEPDTSTPAEKIAGAFGHFDDKRHEHTPLPIIDGATFGEPTKKSLPESAEPPLEPVAQPKASPKASVTVGSWSEIKDGDHDLRLGVSHAANHYTLWYQIPHKDRATPWHYVRILGGNKEQALQRARDAADRIASGDLSGIAFVGKEKISDPKSIGLIRDEMGPEQLMAAESAPLGEQNVGFGKYADTRVKDLFKKDAGYAQWLAESGLSGRGKQVGEYLRNHPDVIAARDADIAAAQEAMTPESIELLKTHGIEPEMLGRGNIVLRGKTYDWKDFIKSLGGKFSDGAWSVSPDGYEQFVARLGGLPKPDGKQRGGIAAYETNSRLGGLRKAADERPDTSGFSEPVERYIGDETKRLIERGRAIGMPEVVVNEQIEDVARINRAYQQEKPLFLLASEPGSGKTFVLGGAIRELQRAGAKRIVYVTLRSELIAQIKNDLKDYGIEGVEFITYPAMRTLPSKDTDALIFDEAHSIKNVGKEDGAAQAKKAAEWIQKSKFTVLSTATPFENPVQAAYLEATGVFDRDFGSFKDFALAYGANLRTFGEQEVFVWQRTSTSDRDAKAAREYFRKDGVFTSRRIRLPEKQVDSRLVKVAVDDAAASQYVAFTKAAAENEGALAGFGAAWVVNFQKRLLEAAKVQHGIREAESALERGRFPILFVETKAERKIDIPDLIERKDRWESAVSEAMKMGDKPPPRSEFGVPPPGVVETLESFMHSTGTERIEIPSAEDIIKKHFGEGRVAIFTGSVTPAKAQQNLDAWRRGEKPVMVATMAKGGTGLSLHDKVGDHQTTQININLPWTATQVVQVSQRSARYGLVGKAEMQWLFADNIPFDRNLASKVGGRMADMGAVVHGERLKDADKIEDWDFESKAFSEVAEPRSSEKEPADALRSSVAQAKDIFEKNAIVRQFLAKTPSEAELDFALETIKAINEPFVINAARDIERAKNVSSRTKRDALAFIEELENEKEPSDAVPADQSVPTVEKPVAAAKQAAARGESGASDQADEPARPTTRPEGRAAESPVSDETRNRVDALRPDLRDVANQAIDGLADLQRRLREPDLDKPDAVELKAKIKSAEKALKDYLKYAESVEPPKDKTVRVRPSVAQPVVVTDEHRAAAEDFKQRLADDATRKEILKSLRPMKYGRLVITGEEQLSNLEAVLLDPQRLAERPSATYDPARPFVPWAIAQAKLISQPTGAERAHKAQSLDENAADANEQYAADKAAAGEELKKAMRKQSRGESTNSLLGPAVPLTPELATAIVKMLKSGLKAKSLTFAVFVRDVLNAAGGTLPANLRKALVNIWNRNTVGQTVTEADFDAAIDGEQFGETPTAIDEQTDQKGPKETKEDQKGPPVETKTAAEMLAPGEDYVSTQNKYAAKVREELGMPERGPVDLKGHTWDDLNEQAAGFGPEHAVNLLAELGDKEKPARAVSDLENFILLRHLRGLQNQRLAAVGEIADAREKGESSREALVQATLTALDQQLKSFVAITEAIGTPAGRLLAARKAFLAMDYSIPKLEYDIEQTQQRPMTPKEKTELSDLHAKYEALKKHAEDVEAKYAEQQAQAAISQAIQTQVTEQKNPASVRKQKARVRFSAAFNIFSKEIATAHSFGSFTPEAFSAAVEMVKASVELGVATVQDFVDSVAKRVGKALNTEVDAGLRKAWDHVAAEAKSPQKLDFDAQNSNSLRRAAQEIMRGLIANGVTNRDSLIDAVHEDLKQYLPEITRRETMMAMSGYGDIRPATSDPIEVVRQDINGQIQAVLKLEDMSHGVAPLHSGQQRNPQSQEKRRLEQEVNEAKRKGGFVTLDPETQLKSTLQARETWLRHRMEDLRFEISKGKRTVKTKTPTPTSPAIEALQAEYELLKAEHEAVFGKRELTDKQKLEIATKHAAKNEAFWADQLDKAQKGEFPAGTVKKPPITSPELETIRAKTKAAQAEFKRLEDAAHPEKKDDARYARAKANVEHWQQRLQDAQNGLFQPRHPKAEDSTGVTLLKSLAAYSRAQAKELDDAAHPERAEQLLNDRYLTSLLRQKLAIESKIASGDIAVKPKVERKLTPEVVQARHDREQAKEKLDELREKARLEGRTNIEKLKDVFAGAWDVTRDLMTTGEGSFLLRQGLLYAAGHPLRFLRATAKSFAVFSKWNNERELFQVNEEIQERPNAKSGLYARGKVPFSDSLSKKTGREELLIGTWAERIPLLGRIIKRNAMAGDAFLNIARADMFDAMAASWSSDPGSVTTAEARVFGSAAGEFTGKGNTGDLATSVKWLNRIFFSFPFTLSRFQIVLAHPLWTKGSTSRTRKAVATEYVRSAIGLFVFYKAIQFALSAAGGGDDEEPVLESNPLSSDFAKWRIGRTRLDPLAGIQQVAVLLARQGFNSKKTASGVTVPLGGMGGRVDDARDVINNFWWSKVHPTPSLYFNLRTGRDMGGNPVTGDDIPKTMIPMSYPDMADAVKETGLPRGLILDSLAFAGAGLNTYGMTTKEMNQAVAMKAADTLIAEDKTRSNQGAMKGKLKSEFTGQHLEDAKQNDAVIKSAREVLMQRVKTEAEMVKLHKAAWDSTNKVGSDAYFDAKNRLINAVRQARQRQGK